MVLSIATAALMLNPPVVTAIDSATPVFGAAPIYLWIVGWGLVPVAVLLLAARTDAIGLSEQQVPPELRDRAGTDSGRADTATTDGASPEG